MLKRILRFLARIGSAVIGLIVILASIAQVLGFIFEYNNVVLESLWNIFKPSPPIPQCVRYETKPQDGQCDALVDASQRLLCRVTVPPTERVCVEYGGATGGMPQRTQPPQQ